MGGGGIFQNTGYGLTATSPLRKGIDVGYGVGVRPTLQDMPSSPMPPTSAEIFRGQEAMRFGLPPGSVKPQLSYDDSNLKKLQDDFDSLSQRRDRNIEGLQKMARGRAKRLGGISVRKVGGGGNYDIEHLLPGAKGKDRFPTLEQTEGKLHPFLKRRY